MISDDICQHYKIFQENFLKNLGFGVKTPAKKNTVKKNIMVKPVCSYVGHYVDTFNGEIDVFEGKNGKLHLVI